MSDKSEWISEWKNEKGEYHRIGGPAYISRGDREMYYENGLKHRLDGPAVIYEEDLTGIYYIYGVNLTKEEHERQAKIILEKQNMENKFIIVDKKKLTNITFQKI